MKPVKLGAKGLFILLILFSTASAFSQEIRQVRITHIDSLIKTAKHPMIINFWASWCGPCLEEMPYLQAAVKESGLKNVELVLVSLDNKTIYNNKLQAFVKEKGWAGTFLWLDETNADYFCPKVDPSWSGAIPATLFINNGNGYRKFVEDALDEAEVAKFLGEMLK